MIILNELKLFEAPFDNEQEIEEVVYANAEHFFGPSSIMIPKAKISTRDGSGTIPDGFAIDLAGRSWYVVEAELAQHSVWSHIAPQVTKQLLAASRPETRQIITEIVVQMFQDDPAVRAKFDDEGVRDIDVRKVLAEILGRPAVVGMPIDRVSDDLRDWAQTLRNSVRLWLVRKFVQLGDRSVVAYDIPEEYRPVLDTTTTRDSTAERNTFDVSMQDLVGAGLLDRGSKLSMSYGARGRPRRDFTATVEDDGILCVLGNRYGSPSSAAVACIQEAGSDRTTVNGWTCWRTADGQLLADLRDVYLLARRRDPITTPHPDRGLFAPVDQSADVHEATVWPPESA